MFTFTCWGKHMMFKCLSARFTVASHTVQAVSPISSLAFGARSQQVPGDSLTAVPGHWLGPSKPPQCDLIHVDGGHTYVLALQDALHFIMHARCGALIVMDDVCDPAHCTTTNVWAIGPSQAWAELLRMGVVRETARKSACEGSLQPYGRHWVMGRVVCGMQAAAPTREPPPIRYTDGRMSNELHAAFLDRWSAETKGHLHTWAALISDKLTS